MKGVFLDANVYYSASRSPSGGSSAICELIQAKKLTLFTTRQVLLEAERNIRKKESDSTRVRFYELIGELAPKIITVDKQKAETDFSKIIDRKDTHVLEGARRARVDFLVTLDKKHFLNDRIRRSKLPFEIVTPGELLRKLDQG